MRSPFLSESEGYHFVLLTVAAFAAIALTSLLWGAWAGVPVWAVLTVAAFLFYARHDRGRRTLSSAPARVGAKGERRFLVIALETVGPEVADVIRQASPVDRTRVFVMAPAAVSSVRRWASDTDDARERAHRVLEDSLARLREEGIEARGEVGDEDPLRAIEDAIRVYGVDEIVVWAGLDGLFGRDVVEGARSRFALPITHVLSGAVATAG